MDPVRPPAWIAALVLALLAMPGLAAATTMYEFSEPEISWLADLVAETEVESSSPERIEGGTFLRTVTGLRLVHVYKGELLEGDRVDLVTLGGKLGEEETDLPSSAVLTPDERVLVFLEEKGGQWRTLGMSQGVFTLVEEPGSGRDLLMKVPRPRGLPSFDEAEIQLPPPAWRAYAEPFLGRLVEDLDAGRVPPYARIPGLDAAKDRRFRKEALRAGQALDPRDLAPGELAGLKAEIEREDRR